MNWTHHDTYEESPRGRAMMLPRIFERFVNGSKGLGQLGQHLLVRRVDLVTDLPPIRHAPRRRARAAVGPGPEPAVVRRHDRPAARGVGPAGPRDLPGRGAAPPSRD